MTTIINVAGVELATEATTADLIAFADVLLRAAQRALHQETTEGVIFEDSDRYALGELIGGARGAIRAAVQC